jgi:hypothetical protein
VERGDRQRSHARARHVRQDLRLAFGPIERLVALLPAGRALELARLLRQPGALVEEPDEIAIDGVNF